MKILCADYVLPIAGDLIEKGAVVVDETRIAAVGTQAKIIAEYPETFIEKFHEAALMPGLVNCHSHLEITAMRGFLDDVESDFYAWLMKLTNVRAEKLTEADIKIAALAGALEGVRAGVTCFGDIGRFGAAGFEALKTNGLRGVIYQETEFSPNSAKADEDFAKLADKYAELKAAETALVTVGLSPHAPYTVSRRLFELIADFAISSNIKTSIHVAESFQERDFFETGEGLFAELYRKISLEWQIPRTSPVQYLADLGVLHSAPLLAHCVNASARDIELIAESRSKIAHCPKSNAKFGHGIAPLERFLDERVSVGFGSDSVASNNVCDILEEARFATLAARASENKKRFLTAREILETATLGGARALGLEREVGTLEAGKQADLVVVSLDNIAQQPIHDVYSAILFASNARDIRMTMVAGDVIYRDGAAAKVDETRIKTRMREIGAKMRGGQ